MIFPQVLLLVTREQRSVLIYIGLIQRKSCLTNLIAFYNVVVRRVDKGRAGDIFCLDFSKDFDNVSSHNILIGRLRKCGLDEWTVRWINNWLNGRSQKVMISRVKSSRKPVVGGDPRDHFWVGVFQPIKGLDVGIQCTLSKFAYGTILAEPLMRV